MSHYSSYRENYEIMKCKSKEKFSPCEPFHKSLRNVICTTIITQATKKAHTVGD